MIKAILFDKDGTLIEFEKTWHSIMALIFERMEEDPMVKPEDIIRLKRLSGYKTEGFETESMIQCLPTSEIAQRWAGEVAAEPEDLQGYRRYFHQLFEKAAVDDRVEVTPLPKVEKTLEYLYDAGYRLGIATSDTEKSLHHSLEKAGLKRYFCFWGSDNGRYKAKPDPQMANAFMEEAGIAPDELLIVGDSDIDRRFAENAKAKFVGIIHPYGIFSGKETGTGVLIHRMSELIDVMALSAKVEKPVGY